MPALFNSGQSVARKGPHCRSRGSVVDLLENSVVSVPVSPDDARNISDTTSKLQKQCPLCYPLLAYVLAGLETTICAFTNRRRRLVKPMKIYLVGFSQRSDAIFAIQTNTIDWQIGSPSSARTVKWPWKACFRRSAVVPRMHNNANAESVFGPTVQSTLRRN